MTGPDLEELLREALERQAQSYEPNHDGLARIRERARQRRQRRRWVWPSAALGGLAATAAAVLVALPAVTGGLSPTPAASSAPAGNVAGHGQHGSPSTGPTGAPSAPASPQPQRGHSPSPAASGTPAPTSGASSGGTASGGSASGGTGGAAGSRAVAVYYTDGDRLVREFHAHPVTPSVVRDAVTAMLTDPPQDPDYGSLWPAGTHVLGVSRHPDQSLITVDLSAAPANDLALQQLIYTVTAADPSTTRVAVQVNGGPRIGPVSRAAGVLAPVWVLAPADGASVPATFTASGTASVFEGTVSWQLVDSAGTVVSHGSTQASTGAPGRGTWSVTVAAPQPGTYTFVGYEASARDGSMQWPDSKTVVVH